MPDTPQEVYGDSLSSRALDHDWRTIYPLGAYQIHGLAWVDPQALWLRQLPRLPFCQATLGASFLALNAGTGLYFAHQWRK